MNIFSAFFFYFVPFIEHDFVRAHIWTSVGSYKHFLKIFVCLFRFACKYGSADESLKRFKINHFVTRHGVKYKPQVLKYIGVQPVMMHDTVYN